MLFFFLRLYVIFVPRGIQLFISENRFETFLSEYDNKGSDPVDQQTFCLPSRSQSDQVIKFIIDQRYHEKKVRNSEKIASWDSAMPGYAVKLPHGHSFYPYSLIKWECKQKYPQKEAGIKGICWMPLKSQRHFIVRYSSHEFSIFMRW